MAVTPRLDRAEGPPPAGAARDRPAGAVAGPVALALCLLAGLCPPVCAAAEGWTAVGPQGAPAAAVAADPGDPDGLLVTLSGEGVFRRDDGGRSFVPSSPDELLALAFHPFARSVVFGVGIEQISKSTDGGASFAVVRAFPHDVTFTHFTRLTGLALAPSDPDTVYAFGLRTDSSGLQVVLRPQLFRSRDGGGTWTDLDVSFGQINALAVDPADPRRLWATSELGVFRSIDGGATWVRSSRGLEDPAASGLLAAGPLVADPRLSGRLAAGTPRGVFVSSDGAATWHRRSAGLPEGRVTALALDPERRTLLAAVVAGTRVFLGSDRGERWTQAGDPQDLPPLAGGLALSAGVPTTLYAGTAEGLYALPVPVQGCASDDTTLCLGPGSRFRVGVLWRDRSGVAHEATAEPLTARAGYFWFFSPANVELVVKVLDGCAINGRVWVFAAGLTDVGTTISVVDTESRATRRYPHAAGTPFQPLQDTAAFAACPGV